VDAALPTRNAQVTGRHPDRSGLVGISADQDCGLNSDFSWSHLWSHSRRFRGVRTRLPSLGSGATRPNRTGLNQQPQNSKAREGQPSAGSNPAATANLTRAKRRPCRKLGASVVDCGLNWSKLELGSGPPEAVETAGHAHDRALVHPEQQEIGVEVVAVATSSKPCSASSTG